MAPNPMPTASGSQQTLSGKSAPDCLFAAGCALACRGKGGAAAYKAGQSFTQVQRCELQSDKEMYQDYMQCMPVQEDTKVSAVRWKICNVVKRGCRLRRLASRHCRLTSRTSSRSRGGGRWARSR